MSRSLCEKRGNPNDFMAIFMTQFKRKIRVTTAQLNTIIYLIDRHLVNDDGNVRRKQGYNPSFTEFLSNDLKQESDAHSQP